MPATLLLVLGACCALAARAAGGERQLEVELRTYVSTFEIVSTMPHDPNAFTQGLTFGPDGTLYESDGLYHHSAVRVVDPATGATLRKKENKAAHFAEGIEVVGNRLIQLTWQNNVLLEYSLPDLELIREVAVKIGREGWGLASDGTTLYVTDSSNSLFHVRPGSYAVTKQVPMHDPRLGRDVFGVNELEWVEGELWGNVYPMYQGTHSECIVRINATSGEVLGWLDFRGLLARQRATVRMSPHNYVLNGIAYHEPTRQIYVTGKNWDQMYQVRLRPQPALGEDHVTAHCNLGHPSGLNSG